jgi:ribosome biogenesis GTPase
VGKSTLLNALEPGLDLRTAEISSARDRGRHTTTSARMFALPSLGARVVDTPGLREIGLWRVAPEELGSLFPEMRPHLSGCSMPRCTHSHEPGCAVKAAAEAGEISPHRYDSYLRILAKLDSA